MSIEVRFRDFLLDTEHHLKITDLSDRDLAILVEVKHPERILDFLLGGHCYSPLLYHCVSLDSSDLSVVMIRASTLYSAQVEMLFFFLTQQHCTHPVSWKGSL